MAPSEAARPVTVGTPREVSVAEIKSRIDMAALVGESVMLKRKGPNHEGWCPFHQGNSPSLTVYSDHANCFSCDWHGDAISFLMDRDNLEFLQAKDILARRALLCVPTTPRQHRGAVAAFTVEDARRTWQLACDRALNDDSVDEDRPAYRYLCERGLGEVWSERHIGIIHESMALPKPVAWWPARGYQILSPLFNERGDLVCVQARAIIDTDKKTLFPKGSVRGVKVFANPRGRDLLAGDAIASTVIIVEGLSDHAAVATALPALPVLGIPGTTHTRNVVAGWAKGRRLVLALDADHAGEEASARLADDARSYGTHEILRVRWGDAGDAAELTRRSGLRALEDVLRGTVR